MIHSIIFKLNVKYEIRHHHPDFVQLKVDYKIEDSRFANYALRGANRSNFPQQPLRAVFICGMVWKVIL